MSREKDETSSPPNGLLPGPHPAACQLLGLPAVLIGPVPSHLLTAETKHFTGGQESPDRPQGEDTVVRRRFGAETKCTLVVFHESILDISECTVMVRKENICNGRVDFMFMC